MEEQGYISTAEYSEALDKGLGLDPGDKYQVIHDAFLFDLVQQQLIDRYGINTVRNGGLKAYTTIDPGLQAKAEEAVENSCYVCYPEGGPAAGLASVNPETGEIVALASTEGYASEEQFNYAWQAHRQPGSSFKTFVLTTAIKQGIDPDSTYYDGSSPMTLVAAGRRHLDRQQLRGRRRRHRVADQRDRALGQRRSSPSSTSTSVPKT